MIEETSMDREATGPPPPLELHLERNVEAPGVARAAVTQLAREVGLPSATFQTLVLLVSEVVSNAVLHSTGPQGAPITLTATIRAEAVRVTVTDSGEGFVPRQRDPASIHDGYGLFLVDKSASRWGVETTAPTSVWFELPRAE